MGVCTHELMVPLVWVIDNRRHNSVKGGSCWMGLFSKKTFLTLERSVCCIDKCILCVKMRYLSVHKKEVTILTLTWRYWCTLYKNWRRTSCDIPFKVLMCRGTNLSDWFRSYYYKGTNLSDLPLKVLICKGANFCELDWTTLILQANRTFVTSIVRDWSM